MGNQFGGEAAYTERTLTRSHSRLSRLLLLVVLTLAAFVPAGSAVSHAAPAHAARTLSLNETGRLHLTSHHSFTLNEVGSASGTISGTINIHLRVASTNHVTAEVTISPRGGSLSGTASANYRPSGATASFSGTMNVTHGSGSYSHAHGTGLSFSGTIQRSTDAITVHVSGRISV